MVELASDTKSLTIDSGGGGDLSAFAGFTAASCVLAELEIGLRFYDPGWRTAARSGVVHAVRLETEWPWLTDSGEEMTAHPGDWMVTREDGSESSITDTALRASHRHLADDLWERVGRHKAGPAVKGEAVESTEGPSIAREGDWVLRDDAGNQWLVAGDKFPQLYRVGESV